MRVVTPSGETTAAGGFQPPEQPVEDLLDDDGDDIEEGVDAADAGEDEEKVAQPVRSCCVALVDNALAAHHIPKTNGAEGHKTEVEGVQVAPALGRRVHERSAAGHQDGCRSQYEHDAVDRRLPAGQILPFPGATSRGPARSVSLGDLPAILREHGLVMASLVTGLEDNGDDGDDALQKEVEEEDGGRTAKQAVEHQEDFPSYSGRRGHTKPWGTHNKYVVRRGLHNETGVSLVTRLSKENVKTSG